MMDIQFRTAISDDADAAVPLIYSSGPAVLDYIFAVRGRDDVFACMRRGFARNAGELGHSIHTVAVSDGRVVGIGTAFSGDTLLRFMLAGTGNIFACYGLAGLGVIRRALQVEQIVQPPKNGVHYVAHLGIAPELRGKGIGIQLIERLHEEGRRLGRKIAALDVSAENPRAQALYERIGYRVTREYVSKLANRHAKVPSHFRMEMDLQR